MADNQNEYRSGGRLIRRLLMPVLLITTGAIAQTGKVTDANSGFIPMDPPGGEINLKISAGLADQRISEMGDPGAAGYFQALEPALAFNPVTGKILVVWRGDDDPGSKDEIYGQMIDVLSMQPVFSRQFRIAELPGGDASDASSPAVVYNTRLNEFLVVWQGVEMAAEVTSQGDEAVEIFGRRVSAEGVLLDPAGNIAGPASGLLKISRMGASDDNGDFDAFQPAVAYSPSENVFLVVWHGDDDAAGLVNGEFEIFGQRLGYNGGVLELIGDRFQISDVSGTNGNSLNDATASAVAYNQSEDEWLVVWEAVEGTTDGAAVYGQRLKSDGSETGDNDFLISETTAPQNEAKYPALAWNRDQNEYLVVWSGEGGAVDGEYEIYGRLLSKNGNAGGAMVRISDMGPDGSVGFRVFAPDVAYNVVEKEYMVTWSGDDNMAPMADGEFEAFAQKLDAAGTEIGDNDFRVSDMGPDGDIRFGAHTPVVSYNGSRLNSYLFVWSGDDDVETVDDELEIFGRLLASSADLGISKTDSVTAAEIGAALTYTIMVKNNGPDAVYNTTVADTFSSDLSDISWTATGDGGAADFEASGTGHILDHHITLPAGASIRYRVQATVSDAALGNGPLLNRAIVIDSVVIDPDPANNTAADTDTRVIRISDLTIGKTDNLTQIQAGAVLTYQIDIHNLGPHPARSVAVTDTFPSVLQDITWTAAGEGGAEGFSASGSEAILDSGIVMPMGAKLTYTVKALVDPAALENSYIDNTAYVADLYATDPDTTNNSATDNDTRIIVDTEPPRIELAESKVLWPPNHKYIELPLEECLVAVTDDRDGPIPLERVRLDSVSSDEPENAKWIGDGCTYDDIVLTDDCRTVMLRKERRAFGNGRVYTIYMSVSDAAGNKATARYLVTVPFFIKFKRFPAVDDGPAYVVVNDCVMTDSLYLPIPPDVHVEEKPAQFVLLQNVPNPFNPETEIRFELPQPSQVELKIYNMLGQVVRTVVSRSFEAGYHTVRWNGTDDFGNRVASGVYIYRMRAGEFVAIKRLVMTK